MVRESPAGEWFRGCGRHTSLTAYTAEDSRCDSQGLDLDCDLDAAFDQRGLLLERMSFSLTRKLLARKERS
jgi:hypothetical protein